MAASGDSWGPPGPKDHILRATPSPTSIEDCRRISDSVLKQFKSLLPSEAGWQPFPFDDPTIQLWEMPPEKSIPPPLVEGMDISRTPPGSPSTDGTASTKSKLLLLKSAGVVDCSLERLLSFIHSSDPAVIQKFEPDLMSSRVVRQWDDGNYAIYLRNYSTPAILDNREFLSLCRLIRQDDGSVIRVATSINFPGIPVTKDFIRGQIIITGYLLTPKSDTQTHVIRISQVDPKGSIPKFLVNTAKKKTGDYVQNLRAAVKASPVRK